MHQLWVERLFDLRPVRWIAAFFFSLRGLVWLSIGRRYRAVADFCWVLRVAALPPFAYVAEKVVFRAIAIGRSNGTNTLVDHYCADPESTKCARGYSITGHGKHDLMRDLLVLKPASEREKGVVLLKYGRTFNAVAALFDLRLLMERYVFVLEPCWVGYCDPGILMFYQPGHPVLVQCFTPADYEFVQKVGPPLIPIRMGPADWVDADVFNQPPADEKPYDLVMVANWAAKKRHALLFKALRDVPVRSIQLLLVGFPWFDRTADNIRREAAKWLPDWVSLTIMEEIPHAELARRLRQCKVLVFLSRKEGDNKAVVEAMFSDVPAIVYDRTVGGAGGRVNAQTGVLASEEDLPAKIYYMLEHHDEFSPRRWALEHTGSAVTTRRLNDALRAAVEVVDGIYREDIVEKINAPNLAYKHAGDRERMRDDYEFILSARRKSG